MKVYRESDTSAFKERKVIKPDGSIDWTVLRPEFRQLLADLAQGVIDIVEYVNHPATGATGGASAYGWRAARPAPEYGRGACLCNALGPLGLQAFAGPPGGHVGAGAAAFGAVAAGAVGGGVQVGVAAVRGLAETEPAGAVLREGEGEAHGAHDRVAGGGVGGLVGEVHVRERRVRGGRDAPGQRAYGAHERRGDVAPQNL